MDGHHGTVTTSHEIAQTAPDVLAFARFNRGKAHFLQPRTNRHLPRAVVPDHDMLLRQAREIGYCVAVFLLCRTIQPDDDPVQVRHLRQLLHDMVQRGGLKLGIQAWQDEGNFPRLGKSRNRMGHCLHRC